MSGRAPRPAEMPEAKPAGEPVERRRQLDVHLPTSAIVRVILAVLLVVVVVQLWLPFLLFLVAVLFAVTLDPLVQRIERFGLRRSGAVLVVAITTFLVLAAGLLLVLPPLSREIGNLVRDFPGIRDRILRDFPGDAPLLRTVVAQVLALPDSPEVQSWLARPLAWGQVAVEVGAGGLVVLMSALYLLVDGKRTYTWLLSYVPRRHRDRMARTVEGVSEVVRSYVRGQCITSLLCGAFTLLLLSILDVPAALPLAVAAAIFDIVPILGTVALLLVSSLLALTVSPTVAAVVFGANLAYHLFENYFVAPRVYGRNLRLSTLSVILALVVGGVLQGVLGAVLVLPLVAAYPIIERIWLRNYLGADVVTDHAALAESADTTREHAVENRVLQGQSHDGTPTPAGKAPGA